LREESHVRKHAVEIEFLLVAGTSNGSLRLTAYRKNGRVVELGIVQTRDQVGRAGTAGRETDSDFASELGMGHGHEGGHFLVSNLDKFDLVGPLQGADNAIDAVAWISIDPTNTQACKRSTTKSPTFMGTPVFFAGA
jgi:hypothetical protein